MIVLEVDQSKLQRLHPLTIKLDDLAAQILGSPFDIELKLQLAACMKELCQEIGETELSEAEAQAFNKGLYPNLQVPGDDGRG